jgi:hypothetical protein
MPALVYDIDVVGTDKIQRAFRTVEQGVRAHNAKLSREIVQPAREAAKVAKQATSGVSAEATARRSQDRVARLERTRDSYEKRRMDSAAAAEHRASMAARRRQIEDMRALEAKRRTAERHEREQTQLKKRLGAEAERDRARAAAKANDTYGTWRDRAGGATKTARHIAGAATGALSIAGGVLVASAVAEDMAARQAASKLANSAGDPSLKGTLLKEASGLPGVDRSESLGMLAQFQKRTGKLDIGRQMLPELAGLAIATGTEFEELSSAAAAAFTQISKDVSDPVEQLKQLKEVMRATAAMGNMGAVEMEDFAREMPRAAATASKYEGTMSENIMRNAALAQVSMETAGSAADAVTGVSRLAPDMETNAKRFKAKGVDVYGKTGKLRAPEQVIADMFDKTGGGTRGQMVGMFGMESVKIVDSLRPIWMKAEREKKGTGRQAVLDAVGKFGKATITDKEIGERVSSRMDDPDMQLKETMKKFNVAIGTELVPALTKIIPELAKLAPAAGQAASMLAGWVSWFAENPATGVAALIGGAIVKDIAGAAIGAGVRAAIMALVSGGSAAGAAGGAAQGATGAAGGLIGRGLAAGGAALGVGGAALATAAAITAATVGTVAYAAYDIPTQLYSGKTDNNKALEDFNERERAAVEELRQRVAKSREGLPPSAGSAPVTADTGGGAAAALNGAADKLSSAAEKIGTAALNRGDKPSPVKG